MINSINILKIILYKCNVNIYIYMDFFIIFYSMISFEYLKEVKFLELIS